MIAQRPKIRKQIGDKDNNERGIRKKTRAAVKRRGSVRKRDRRHKRAKGTATGGEGKFGHLVNPVCPVAPVRKIEGASPEKRAAGNEEAQCENATSFKLANGTAIGGEEKFGHLVNRVCPVAPVRKSKEPVGKTCSRKTKRPSAKTRSLLNCSPNLP